MVIGVVIFRFEAEIPPVSRAPEIITFCPLIKFVVDDIVTITIGENAVVDNGLLYNITLFAPDP